MILLDDKHTSLPEPCVATIGFFDGVHKGHRSLIGQVRAEAAVAGLSSAIITFEQHPRQVLHADFVPELLTTLPEKIELLRQTGLDYCLLLSFTPDLSSLSALQFMQQVVQGRCNARTLMVGYDHRFGHDRSEGFEHYLFYGKEIGLSVKQAFPLYQEERAVSSSLIRRLLQESGDVTGAAHALGYFYSLTGRVVHGRKLGHKLGFPTANLECSPEKLIPADGVYAVGVYLADEGAIRPGVLNIGCRPTLRNGEDRTVEVHIPHYSGNLYGTVLKLSFLSRIRSQQDFPSIEELAAQIARDTEHALEQFSLLYPG